MRNVTPRDSEPITPADVSKSFDIHARSYDKLVGANPGYHEHLRLSARRMGLPDKGAGLRLLDLGCGTGASTAALLDVAPEAEVVAVDASSEMLAQARRKVWPPRVRFVHADAEDLGDKVEGPFDGILAAYLLRNLTGRDAALCAFRDLLAPGAPLAVHEYSVRDSLPARLRWSAVCWSVMIPMGRIRSGRSDLYRYLWRSVLDFDGVAALRRRMGDAGYVDLRVQTVPGWQKDIVHTFLGRRPGGVPPGTDGETATPSVGVPVEDGGPGNAAG
jgi:ubiquinone/menaquinone biosynthesis C-methylase UbiE